LADAKYQMGTIMPNEPGYQNNAKEKFTFKTKDSDIPESFDARTTWSQCANIIGHVRDQSNCGSCWAHGSTEAFNDRYCMKTGDNKTLFSTEDTNDCCSGSMCLSSRGCNGGLPSGAWNWFTQVGVSTGGDYTNINQGTTCKPYTLQACSHHVAPPAGSVACDSLPSYATPACTVSCSETAYNVEYSKDKHLASSFYAVRGEKNLQKELLENGPVTVSLLVYEDLEVYSGGVYQHVSGEFIGGHTVKLIGWGIDATLNNTPYWIIVNSWNTNWGENGLFRMIRGKNDCMIEMDGVAGDV